MCIWHQVRFSGLSEFSCDCPSILSIAGINLGTGSANRRRRYIVTSSLTGWVHTKKGILQLDYNSAPNQMSDGNYIIILLDITND